jgi:ABC-type uncharacterized transport system involved in gliding motility auxiliary subunit
MKKPTSFRSMRSFAGALVALGIVIALNVLLGGVRLRADLTEEDLYTLSEGTRTLLKALERPVTLKLYFSRSAEEAPIPLKQYAQRVADLLKEYEALSDGRVILETIDPRPDSDEEEWAQRYGLQGAPLDMTGLGAPVYFGLVGVSGSREAAIPFLTPDAEPQLEYQVTRLLAEITRDRPPVIGVLSSLPVMGEPAMPFGMPPAQEARKWAFLRELERQVELRELQPDFDRVPDELDALVLIHPKDLSDAALFAIDQYLLRGGRLLAFVDPVCISDEPASPSPYGAPPPGASDLNRLTAAWGFEMVPGQVVADVEAASRISFGPQQGTDLMPTWLSLRAANLNEEDVATSALESLMMPFAGMWRGAPTNGLDVVELIHTSEDSSLVDSFRAVQPGLDKMRTAPPAGRVPLALRFRGRFPTAFPGGPPVEGANEAGAADGAHLAEAEADGTAVLVADADMLADRFSLNEMRFFGQSIYEPLNDNLAFALNLVEQLGGSEALIGLRSRGATHRPFERVIELEREAQKRWQDREIELTDQLQRAQAKLNELQRAKEEDQRMILSPEQKREIEKFREQRFETQQQLKEVRRNLRADIERLGLQLKVVNMALMPAAVALFGLAYGWRRRRRSQ